MVSGSYFQGNIPNATIIGNQCTAIIAVSIAFSLIKRLNFWNSEDLDNILQLGNEYYREKNLQRLEEYLTLSPKEADGIIVIQNKKIQVTCIENETILGLRNNNSNDSESNLKDGINKFINSNFMQAYITTGEYTMGLFKEDDKLYYIDTHSRNNSGLFVENGTSILLDFYFENAAEQICSIINQNIPVRNFSQQNEFNILLKRQFSIVPATCKIITEKRNLFEKIGETIKKSIVKKTKITRLNKNLFDDILLDQQTTFSSLPNLFDQGNTSNICDVGSIVGTICNKKELFQSEIKEDLIPIIRKRLFTDFGNSQFRTICQKHLNMFTRLYETNEKGKGCSNKLVQHKKKPSKNQLSTISDEEEKIFKSKYPNLIQGKQLCIRCKITINKSLDLDKITGISHDILSTNPNEGQPDNSDIEMMDTESTISSFVLPIQHTKSFSSFKACPNCSSLIKDLKIKFKNTNSKMDKYKILTCAPKSLGREELSKLFDCTEYQARQAVSLIKSFGHFSYPQYQERKGISNEMINKVFNFYQSEYNSKPLPGRTRNVINPETKEKLPLVKRYMYSTLQESYLEFKSQLLNEEYNEKIGISSFAKLRPLNCKYMGQTAMHNTCLCIVHENFKLLIESIKKKEDPHFKHTSLKTSDILNQIVCNVKNHDCAYSICSICPHEDKIAELMGDFDLDEKFTLRFWKSTDRTEILEYEADGDEIISKIKEYIPKILKHHFVSIMQKEFIINLKADLLLHMIIYQCIVQIDFSENFTFLIQDEVQSAHWTRPQVTLHPFYVTLFDSEKNVLVNKCYFVISNHKQHNTVAVFAFITKFISELKSDFPKIQKIIYISDGCAGQYKNYKNFINLLHHKKDFGIDAEHIFTATCHGKSPGDALGGSIKSTTRRESLRGRIIQDSDQMFNFLQEKFANKKDTLKFIHIKTNEVNDIATKFKLEERFKQGKTIPGTQTCHHFAPDPTNPEYIIIKKYSSSDVEYKYRLRSNIDDSNISFDENFTVGDFIIIKALKFPLATILSIDNGEYKVKYMKPRRVSNSFIWPDVDNEDFILREDILLKVSSPTSKDGYIWNLNASDFKKIPST